MLNLISRTLEEKFQISARPCIILSIFTMFSKFERRGRTEEDFQEAARYPLAEMKYTILKKYSASVWMQENKSSNGLITGVNRTMKCVQRVWTTNVKKKIEDEREAQTKYDNKIEKKSFEKVDNLLFIDVVLS